MKNRTLRAEFLLWMLGVLLGTLGVTMLALDDAVGRSAVLEIDADLTKSKTAYERFLHLHDELLSTTVGSLSEAPYLKAALAAPAFDARTLRNTIREMWQFGAHERLLLLDARGRLVAENGELDPPARDLSRMPGIAEAREGETTASIWSESGGFCAMAISPVVVGNQLVGFLAAGHVLDSRYARDLLGVTGREVLVCGANRVAGEAWRDESRSLVGESAAAQDLVHGLLAQARPGEPFWIEILGEARRAIAIPAGGDGPIVLLSESREAAFGSFREARTTLGWITVVAALLTLGVSLLVSGRLARPIEQLTRASNLLAAGDFGVRVEARGSNEIRTLASSFNAMAQKIGELIDDVRRTTRTAAEAEASARVKREFLANMSHEIRTPMNGVMGMTELMLGTAVTEEQRDYLGTIQRSGESLLAIINDILDFSKIEAGRMQLESLPFDLRTGLEDVFALLATRAQGKGLDFTCSVEPEVPQQVVGDPTRLRQVLLNLLGNALKFTEHGEAGLRLTTRATGPGEVLLRFEVFDTGIGIPDDVIPRLFQSFSQADASTTRRFGGTGLGLAISQHLVRAMGGDIAVESVPGKGTVFSFELHMPVATADATTGSVVSAEWGHLRALCVDDNAAARTILARQLAPYLQQVDTAEGARSALERLRAAAMRGEPYDLAILDLQMPETNGLELARMIRAEPALAGLRLGMVTSSFVPDIDAMCAQADIAMLLLKPVRQAQMLAAVARLMGVSAPGGRRPAVGVPMTRAAPGSGPRVLLAEDNLVNQKVGRLMLERLGCTVEVVGDGRAAVEAWERDQPALIFMDCQMPEMDGYQACRAIRQRQKPGVRGPAILALTASAMEGDRARCFEAGMDDFLTKPISLASLGAAVKRWVFAAEPDSTSTAMSSSRS
ncbi:MAG: response regulator [Planctomycetes bacterium]|nr:response regulator [Planctomycetota bacterium]